MNSSSERLNLNLPQLRPGSHYGAASAGWRVPQMPCHARHADGGRALARLENQVSITVTGVQRKPAPLGGQRKKRTGGRRLKHWTKDNNRLPAPGKSFPSLQEPGPVTALLWSPEGGKHVPIFYGFLSSRADENIWALHHLSSYTQLHQGLQQRQGARFSSQCQLNNHHQLHTEVHYCPCALVKQKSLKFIAGTKTKKTQTILGVVIDIPCAATSSSRVADSLQASSPS